MDNIRPYVVNISASESRGSTEESQSPWFVDLGVTVGDKVTAERYKSLGKVGRWLARHSTGEFTGRPNGELGRPIFFLVCSSSYVQEPDLNAHSKDDLQKALIQITYDEAAAKSYITSIVNDCPAGSFEVVEKYLQEHFDIGPWLNDVSGQQSSIQSRHGT